MKKMELNEKIALFQQGNKTTIVIYNLKESTKKKLAELLLSDIQAIDDLKPKAWKEDKKEAETGDMVSVFVRNAAEGKNGLSLIAEMVKIYDNPSFTHEDRLAAAGYLKAEILKACSFAVNQMQNFIFKMRHDPRFSEILVKICRQKGCGDGIDPSKNKAEYDTAVVNALKICDEEELQAIITKAGENYMEM